MFISIHFLNGVTIRFKTSVMLSEEVYPTNWKKKIDIEPKKMTRSYKNDHVCKKKKIQATQENQKEAKMITNNHGHFASYNPHCGGLSCVL